MVSAAQWTTELVIEGHRPAQEAVVGTAAMRFIPFTVPAGVTAIRVEPHYEHGRDPNQRNTVDLGLWDARGTGPTGFRGWQGGSPEPFTLTGRPDSTSPWYLPGEIRPGTWFLAQYYLKAAPDGLGYRYRIRFTFGEATPPPGLAPLPADPKVAQPTAPGWYAGNLHNHSRHSDGSRTLAELAEMQAKAGYAFWFATEHNTSAHGYALASAQRPGTAAYYGYELTTPGGHANILGGPRGRWHDFRTQPGDGLLAGVLRRAADSGAFIMINHPFAPCTSCPWKFDEQESAAAHAVEVWNREWDVLDDAAVKWWHEGLVRGLRRHAVGGSDYHRGDDPLFPATWVFTKGGVTEAGVLHALREGRTIVAERADRMPLSAQVGGRLPGEEVPRGVVRVDAEYREGTLYAITDTDRRVWTAADRQIDLSRARFVRFELRVDGPASRMIAMTNAFFVRR
jgi:hypothetical protein